jgi:hypothetical protein
LVQLFTGERDISPVIADSKKIITIVDLSVP